MTDTGTALKRDRRILRWLLLGLIVFFGGAYVAAYAFTGDRIARGTTIGGVDVGGKTRDDAVHALANGLQQDTDRGLTLSAGDQTFKRSPADLGLELDATASVQQVAVGRSWNPTHLWEFVAGGSSYEPVLTIDDTVLDTALAAIADKVDQKPKEGGVRLTDRGTAEAVQPRAGRTIDLAAARSAIEAAYPLATDQPVALSVVTAEPAITAVEVARVMKDFANPAMSAPVVLVLGGERVTLQPKDYAAAVTLVPTGARLEPQLDKAKLQAVIEPAMKNIALAPQDASVQIVDGKPQVIPGKEGVTFDPEEVAAKFLGLVVGQGPAREAVIETKIATPEFTEEEMAALGIKEQVSFFPTYYPHAEYRNINIGRAAELINGTVLKPGEIFSMNETVGERTAENGFTEGFIISNGILVRDLGGGVSQTATTTFNAAFFAGLKDIEHKPHSFYISRYPAGREATVAWPTVDLKFQNDTPYGILIQAWREPSTPSRQGSMNVRMWSTKVWDIEAGASARYNFTTEKIRRLSGPKCEPNAGYGGFDIDVYRYFRKPGSAKLEKTETFKTTYTPSDTVICS